jgi:hypothetical protein
VEGTSRRVKIEGRKEQSRKENQKQDKDCGSYDE